MLGDTVDTISSSHFLLTSVIIQRDEDLGHRVWGEAVKYQDTASSGRLTLTLGFICVVKCY